MKNPEGGYYAAIDADSVKVGRQVVMYGKKRIKVKIFSGQ